MTVQPHGLRCTPIHVCLYRNKQQLFPIQGALYCSVILSLTQRVLFVSLYEGRELNSINKNDLFCYCYLLLSSCTTRDFSCTRAKEFYLFFLHVHLKFICFEAKASEHSYKGPTFVHSLTFYTEICH